MSSRQTAILNRRLHANRRERQRVNHLNGMFQHLLRLLPQSSRRPGKMTRVRILREAAAYIQRLREYLDSPESENINAEQIFPHAFQRSYNNQLSTYERTLAPAGTVITTSSPM